MSSVLSGNSWTHRGISLLWDPATFGSISNIDEIYSIRQYLTLSNTDWPEELPSAGGYAMVVAGIDTIMDVMEPNELVDWLEKVLYPTLLSFQNTYEGQCALIFWITDGQKRLVHNTTDGIFYWKCSGIYHDQLIPLSSCLWNGAAIDAKLIVNHSSIHDIKDKGCIGLFHPRIS